MSPKPRRRLFLEQLEDRLTPSTTAVPWPNPGHLTLSFPREGSSTGQQGSTLFQNLDAVTSTYNWQLAILRAYQTWAVNGNVNVAVVPDGGEAFGAPGVPQGDSRFGEFRVGMASLAETALANTAPFTWAGTTWAGDTLLNSDYGFGVNGVGGPYDLSTVMLHEAGLAFGMQDSPTDASTVMYDNYVGVRTSLSAPDVAGFQSLYGTRSPDAYQGSTGDNSFATAYGFTALPLGGVNLQADLGRYGEAEYYKFSAPVGTTALTVNLKTAGISSLLAQVTVLNGNQQVLGSASASNPMNGNVTVRVPGSLLGGTYYVEVSGATTDVFSIGSYQLSVGVSTALGVSLPQSTYTAPISLTNPGSILSAALGLLPHWTSPSNLAFNATYYGQLNSASQQNWFYVGAPPVSAYGTGPLVMVAEAWGTDPGAPLHPQVQVWSAGPSPHLLASEVLTNDHGVFTVQVPDAATGGDGYAVEVEPLNPGGSNSTGNYFLGVNFHAEPPVTLGHLGGGTLTQASPQECSQMTVNQNELWHFRLSADTGGSNVAEEVQMQVYNAAGQVIFSLISYAGQPPSTGCVYLTSGTYTLVFTAVAQQPDQFADLAFDLDGENLSYPIAAMMTPTNYSGGGGGGTAPTSSSTSPTSSGGTYTPPKYS